MIIVIDKMLSFQGPFCGHNESDLGGDGREGHQEGSGVQEKGGNLEGKA